MIVGLGEIVGGAIAPAVTGGVAQHAGISVIMQVALGSAVIGLLIAVLGTRKPETRAENEPSPDKLSELSR